MELNRHELLELIGMITVRISEAKEDMSKLINVSSTEIVAKRIRENTEILNKLKEQFKNR